MKHRGIASTLVVLVAAGGLTLGGCTTDDDESTPALTEETQTTTPTERETKQEESPQGGREEDNERKDLISFQIDDRSQAGFTDIWVTWTIKNNSSEKSNYSWDWEAVDASGTRIANSTEYVNNVQPGQTATGESPTVIKDPNVKINITDFQRTKAY